MLVQFNNGRFSLTNSFIHKSVFGNSIEICNMCDQYSTNMIKKQNNFIVFNLNDK